MTDDYVAGVDLGGTKLLAAVAKGPRVLAEQSWSTSDIAQSGLAAGVSHAVREVVGQAGLDLTDLAVTAVGGAGAPQVGGSLRLAPNLKFDTDAPFVDELQRNLGHPVVLENDANAAAIGESSARGSSDLAFIAIGTGIGMGIVLAGKPLRGARNAAGEIGFLPFGADPRNPRNQVRGPLEEVVSGGGIERAFADLTGEPLTSHAIFAASLAGVDAATTVIENTAFEAARAICAVAAILDPAEIVLGGGIGSRPDFLARVVRHMSDLGQADLGISSSRLGERAALIGAVVLANRYVAPAMEGTTRS